MTEITVDNVDVALLKKQRNWLYKFAGKDEAEGLINLLDNMLDTIEEDE